MISSRKVAARRYGVRTSIADERSQENSKQKHKQNKTKVTKKFKLQDSLRILIFLKMLLFMRHANLNQVIKSSVSPVFRQLRFLQISKCVRLKKSPKESILLKTLKSNNHIYLITISLGLTCGKF